MAEVYASPAKRRKTCADPMSEQEALLDDVSKAGHPSSSSKSRLKGGFISTPSKLKQQHKEEPKTPGGAKKKQQLSSNDEGLLSLSPQLLSPNLMLLNQLLGALYVTLPLVRSRGKPTTYHNMRVPVQNFCGRDFQVKHVQQIKALCPEALGWEHILALNPTTKRQEQQLCISMPADPADPKQAADTNQLQQTFFQRLQQHQACAGSSGATEPPLAELPAPAGPSTRDCTPSRQRIGGLLPGTPQTAPPAASNTNANSMMVSPPPKRLATAVRAPGAATNSQQHALMSPPPARTRGNNRRLVMGDSNPAGDQGGFTFSPAPRQQPDLLLSPRGGGGGALMPLSMRNLAGTPVRAADATPDRQGAARGDGAVAVGHQTPNNQALRPNRLFADTPLAASTPQQSSAARPNTHDTPEAGAAAAGGRTSAAAAGVKVRKLTFDAAAPTASAAAAAAAKKASKSSKSGAGVSEEAAAAAGAEPGGGEASRTRGGLKFELGETAMALLKQVSSAEVKQEAADKHQQLEQQRALDMLPGSFEVLRAIYGERGPCVKPKSEVLQLLRQKSTSKSGMSVADAVEQLDLMLRLVPEFLRTVTSSGMSLAALGAPPAALPPTTTTGGAASTQSVRINRQLSWGAARQKLLAGAAEARCSGSAAAAAAVAAEQQREAAVEAAAVVAAAASVELDDDEAGSGVDDDMVSGGGSESESEAAAVVDELGLDVVLAELDGNASGGSSSQQTAKGAVDGGGGRSSSKLGGSSLADEALALLGGGGGSRGSRGKARVGAAAPGGGLPSGLLGALTAVKAPAARKNVSGK